MDFTQPSIQPIEEIPINIFGVQENEFRQIKNKKFYISKSLDGTSAATAGNYSVIFNVPFMCYVSEVRVSWTTAGTSSTLNIEKLTGTQALDAGLEMLATDLSTTTTANTVATPTLIETIANKNLTRGDRIALKDSGDLTNLAGLCVTIELTQTI